MHSREAVLPGVSTKSPSFQVDSGSTVTTHDIVTRIIGNRWGLIRLFLSRRIFVIPLSNYLINSYLLDYSTTTTVHATDFSTRNETRRRRRRSSQPTTPSSKAANPSPRHDSARTGHLWGNEMTVLKWRRVLSANEHDFPERRNQRRRMNRREAFRVSRVSRNRQPKTMQISG